MAQTLAIFYEDGLSPSPLVLTVPSGQTWVIRQIHVCNKETEAGYCDVYIVPVSTPIGVVVGKKVNGNDVFDQYFSPGLMVTTGQQLWIGGGNGDIFMQVMGYVVT